MVLLVVGVAAIAIVTIARFQPLMHRRSIFWSNRIEQFSFSSQFCIATFLFRCHLFCFILHLNKVRFGRQANKKVVVLGIILRRSESKKKNEKKKNSMSIHILYMDFRFDGWLFSICVDSRSSATDSGCFSILFYFISFFFSLLYYTYQSIYLI